MYAIRSYYASIIRSLGMGVSGAGSVAVSVSGIGNGVSNEVTAEITDGSTVTRRTVGAAARARAGRQGGRRVV